jgi:hypothetical protein
MLILHDELTGKSHRIYDVFISDFSIVSGSSLILTKDEDRNLNKLLLVSHKKEGAFMDENKKIKWKSIDLTPLIKPE